METNQLLNDLVTLSRHYGADPEMVIAGGGNTSVKQGDRLWVKGSGTSLANITPEGFVEMDRPKLACLLQQKLSTDRMEREAQFKSYVLAARLHPEKGQRPSVEAVLHHLMPATFVVHTHCTLANMFTCCVNGQAILRENFADSIIYIGPVDPGFALAVELQSKLTEFTQRTSKPRPRAVVMENHGLVTCGDTPEQVKADTDWLLAQLGKLVPQTPAPFGQLRPRDPNARQVINTIAPALRALLGQPDRLKIVTFDDSDPILQLVCGAEGQKTAAAGALSPDQIVYCKSFPLWFDPSSSSCRAGSSTPPSRDARPDSGERIDPATLVSHLRTAIANHEKQTRFTPTIVLVKDVGLFAIGDDYNAANSARMVYLDAVKVMAGARRLGGVRYLTEDFRRFIEDWEVESYRKTISLANRSAGRTAGKIAIVTGAAQGFGLEISQHFIAEGGIAILTDMNADGAKAAAATFPAGKSLGLPVNVTDSASLDDMIHQVIRTFGGFDVFISNAGVLKAASVKTQSEKDFDFVTSVNYKGFFLCTQKAVPTLSIQHLACQEGTYMSDIIQINSKSGLRGSNKNGAYAGSKFGGIGLVQSFAMELIEDGIKVNAICPGNFFDGPLWSDPKTGLFVQYLNTGKVPGAKTIEDVRKFYEAQAPIRRGCTTPDVMKAVYYLIDQTYETGQAVPVTGGQVMLK